MSCFQPLHMKRRYKNLAKQFTRNYDNLFSYCFGCRNSSHTTTETPTHEIPHFKHPDGYYFTGSMSKGYARNAALTTVCIPDILYYGASNQSPSCETFSSIQIGTGNTPPSYEDYCLHTPLSNNLTLGTVSYSSKYDSDTHIYTLDIKIPIIYNGTESVTASEYGIFVGIPRSVSGSSVYSLPTMIYRETLDEPVTLEQNDTIEITFSQSIVQPNYTPYPTE